MLKLFNIVHLLERVVEGEILRVECGAIEFVGVGFKLSLHSDDRHRDLGQECGSHLVLWY